MPARSTRECFRACRRGGLWTTPINRISRRSSGTCVPYVPAQIGAGKYLLHLMVGAAKFDDLKIIEAEPVDAFTVHPAGVAVYHLGNNGTARNCSRRGR